jgi:hypothetical protein
MKTYRKGLNPCFKVDYKDLYEKIWRTRSRLYILEKCLIQILNEDKFLTYQKFNVTPHNSLEQTWFYGITLEEFNNWVFIMTPGEFKDVSEDSRRVVLWSI